MKRTRGVGQTTRSARGTNTQGNALQAVGPIPFVPAILPESLGFILFIPTFPQDPLARMASVLRSSSTITSDPGYSFSRAAHAPIAGNREHSFNPYGSSVYPTCRKCTDFHADTPIMAGLLSVSQGVTSQYWRETPGQPLDTT